MEQLHQRLRAACQASSSRFLGFDAERRFFWGYETRRAGSRYYWDGLKRRVPTRGPQVLFQFTLAGRGEYAERNEVWPVEPGQAFTVLLPSAHRYYLPKDSERWTFFWFIVRHPFIAARMELLRRREAAVQRWTPGFPALEAAAALIEDACRGRIRDVWTFEELLFAWLFETERELHQRRYPQDERDRLLNDTRRRVRARLSQPYGVPELAELHQAERTTFSRRFKAATGVSPASFITEVRLEEAMKLLRTEAKLEEVARRTGFADANHFCKVFRRHFHTSPGSYRRMNLRTRSRGD